MGNLQRGTYSFALPLHRVTQTRPLEAEWPFRLEAFNFET